MVRSLRAPFLCVALLACLMLAPAGALAFGSPKTDPFYTPPADLASVPLGGMIRSRDARLELVPGLRLPYKTYQVLYRTNDHRGVPVAVTATIALPLKRPKSPAARKLVSYQTAYDGLGPNCQPSLSLQNGSIGVQGVEMVLISALLQKGWTIVTTDYEGPQNLWLNGPMSAHGVLDGIRAAEDFEPAGLNGRSTPVGLVGYSGGGHATAWANELYKSYAPDLNIVGSSQGGIPNDLPEIFREMDGGALSGVVMGAAVGLDKAYPEVRFRERYLNDRGRRVFKTLENGCIFDFTTHFGFTRFRSISTVHDLMAVPEIREIATRSNLGAVAPSVPTLMYYAVHDQLGGYDRMRDLGRRYCAAGSKIRFGRGDNDEHLSLVIGYSGRVIQYISQRFSGAPVQSNCGSF